MFTYYNTTTEVVFVMLDGLCTFMLFTVSLNIFAIDIGKVDLLRHNRKIFGSVYSFLVASSYLFFAVVFMNIQLSFPTEKCDYIKTCQAVTLICLLASIIPMISVLKYERAEVKLLSNPKDYSMASGFGKRKRTLSFED